MSARAFPARVQPVPPRFDAPLLRLPLSQRDLLGLAWLLEQSARACERDGDASLAALLRRAAAGFRARAVNQ